MRFHGPEITPGAASPVIDKFIAAIKFVDGIQPPLVTTVSPDIPSMP
jgi:hypothetical protein